MPRLVDIATQMRAALVDSACVYRRLAGGLELQLARADHHYYLTLRRMDVAPSDTEVRICRTAFGVPDDTSARTFARRMITPKTHELALYRGLELHWQELS